MTMIQQIQQVVQRVVLYLLPLQLLWPGYDAAQDMEVSSACGGVFCLWILRFLLVFVGQNE